jgi:hypothetical protein
VRDALLYKLFLGLFLFNVGYGFFQIHPSPTKTSGLDVVSMAGTDTIIKIGFGTTQPYKTDLQGDVLLYKLFSDLIVFQCGSWVCIENG